MNTSDAVFWFSLLGLFVFVLRGFSSSRNIAVSLFWLVVLAVSGGAYFYVFESHFYLKPKGEQSSWPAMVVLYICTVVGMGFHYCFVYFMKPKPKREPFDFGLFIAPLFVSPIIFAPLWSAFQYAGVTLSSLRYAAFFVAFENGFFWKEFFDNRRKHRQ